MVTMRSSSAISQDRAFNSVVLPEPVPPTTARSCLSATAHESRPAYHSGSDPISTSCASELMRSENLRMVSAGPSIAMGGMTAFTR